MDAETRDRFAIRCIVVSTQSGMAKIARAHAEDPDTRDWLREATLKRGHALLTELEHEHVLSGENAPALRAARDALSD